MINSRIALVAASVVFAACSGSSDDAGSSTNDSSVESAAPASAGNADRETDDLNASTNTSDVPVSTEVLRPGVVAFDGSVESLILFLPDARNFATGVEEWLVAVPGQEGVLRNSRGITMFVPADEGFSEAAKEASFADPDIAASTIGDHLHVGALAELAGSITMATGTEHEISEDGLTVGGRQVLRVETAANGVVYVIDGPLPGDDG